MDQTPLGSPKPVRNFSKPNDMATLAKHLQGPTISSLNSLGLQVYTENSFRFFQICCTHLLEIKAAALLCRNSKGASSRFEFMIHSIRRNMERVAFKHRVEQLRLASLHSNATAMKKTTLAVQVHHLSYDMLQNFQCKHPTQN